jgi:hypothetical protein
MDWLMMCAMWSAELPMPSGPTASCAGQPILAFRIMTGSSAGLGAASRSTHCSTIRSDWSISSIRTR